MLGDPVRGSIIQKSIFHEDHGVNVHVLTTNELHHNENHLLAVDPSTDANIQLELFCGLHGTILSRLGPDCHLVSPIVMVRGGNRPLKIEVIIPHALAAHKNQIFDEFKVLTVKTAGGIPEPLQSSEYTVDSENCVVMTVINKEQLFVAIVMGNLKSTRTKLLPSITPTPRPPAITCVYAVLCNNFKLSASVEVYCAIDLPIIRKVCNYSIITFVLAIIDMYKLESNVKNDY